MTYSHQHLSFFFSFFLFPFARPFKPGITPVWLGERWTLKTSSNSKRKMSNLWSKHADKFQYMKHTDYCCVVNVRDSFHTTTLLYLKLAVDLLTIEHMSIDSFSSRFWFIGKLIEHSLGTNHALCFTQGQNSYEQWLITERLGAQEAWACRAQCWVKAVRTRNS